MTILGNCKIYNFDATSMFHRQWREVAPKRRRLSVCPIVGMSDRRRSVDCGRSVDKRQFYFPIYDSRRSNVDASDISGDL